MENYDLRSCYLPDLSGLHVRIFQFGELLKRHLPALAAHLDHLQIEPAYVSQWFLSFFAVTCPLPMLFRIYDVIFAEGASETMMRVALAVMRKNEERITACAEFEDVMQLLLSRGLWDCYRMDADAFVNDFVSLTGTITNDLLQSLERKYSESQESGKAPAHSADIVSAGSRFLGRMWTSSSKSMTLNPATLAPYRRAGSFLRKSTSKQSMASTLGSGEGSTDSSTTEATSRGSSQSDGASVRVPSAVLSAAVGSQKALASSNKSLNGQIEDLLLALSEMQREQAVLATRLQREREDREEDRVAVRLLIEVLKKNGMEAEGDGTEAERVICMSPENMPAEEAGKEGGEASGSKHDSPMEHAEASPKEGEVPSASSPETEDTTPSTLPPPESSGHDLEEESPGGTPAHISLAPLPATTTLTTATATARPPSTPTLPALLTTLPQRFSPHSARDSAVLQSKAQLRADLAHTKGQLGMEVSKNQDLARRLLDCEREVSKLAEQVREGHAHVRQGQAERGRLEKVVSELRSRGPSAGSGGNDGDEGERTDWSRRASAHSSNGLRELKLGRQKSTRSPVGGPGGFAKRSSSLYTSMIVGEDEEIPPVPPSPGSASLHAPSLAPSLSGQGGQGGGGGGDNDALILELVQAKTAEATARQEAEEARGKLEALRRMVSGNGNAGGGGGPPLERQVSPGARSRGGTPPAAAAAATGGGFWGWGKRSASLAGLPGGEK